MTLQNIFESVAANNFLLVYYFLIVPALALVIGLISGKDAKEDPWRYLFSIIIYLVCVPGIFSIVLCAYSFAFEQQNLLEVNALVYFLPIVSMVGTLVVVKQKIELVAVPGFGRISGLLMVLAATFVLVLLLQKTRIWIVFNGSLWHLVGVVVILFLIIKFGSDRLMRKATPD